MVNLMVYVYKSILQNIVLKLLLSMQIDKYKLKKTNK
jgi:hypothetical protein